MYSKNNIQQKYFSFIAALYRDLNQRYGLGNAVSIKYANSIPMSHAIFKRHHHIIRLT